MQEPRFVREKKDSILNPHDVEVHYTEASGFRIIANTSGIRFSGLSAPFAELIELDVLAKTVSLAWADHVKLRKSLQKKILGE